MENERYLVCVSGPAGVGKGTVVKELMARHPEIELSVSATTRAPRPGEVNHREYHFVTQEEFQQAISRDMVLEYDFHFGNYYGTPRSEVEKRIADKTVVILEIDVNGTGSIKRRYPGALTVFILPPSPEELKRRLTGRGTESEQSVKDRLDRVAMELKQAEQYDVSVVNADVGQCAEELYRLIRDHIGE